MVAIMAVEARGYYDESHQGVPRHVGRRDVLTHCYKGAKLE